MNISDFHVHSLFSDDDLCPANIVRDAKLLGMKGISLNDHDTIYGIDIAKKWFDDTISYH